jgi:hypothetical protein
VVRHTTLDKVGLSKSPSAQNRAVPTLHVERLNEVQCAEYPSSLSLLNGIFLLVNILTDLQPVTNLGLLLLLLKNRVLYADLWTLPGFYVGRR